MINVEVQEKLVELNKLDQKYRWQWESGGPEAIKLHKEGSANIDSRHLTNWIDAMNMQRGIPQVYGQYFVNRGKGYEIYQIENLQELDKRRKGMGHESFDERIRNVLDGYPLEDQRTILESYKRIFGKEFSVK